MRSVDIVKIFLGEGQGPAFLDEALFLYLFSAGMSKSMAVIKSRVPIPYQDKSVQHVHANYEFTVPLSHSPRLLIESKQFVLPRRNIFPCNPGQSHGPAEEARQHRIIAMQFTPSALREISETLFGSSMVKFDNISTSYTPEMDKLIDLFIDESQNEQTGHEFILEHLDSLLGACLLRTLKSNLNLPEQQIKPRKKMILQALDFLHDNYDQDFSLTDVADLVGISKYHLIREFKKETGKTPYQYFIDLKIEKAVELIKMHRYSITEVCFMCGFKHHSHFSRVFVKKMGVTPSRFKELCN